MTFKRNPKFPFDEMKWSRKDVPLDVNTCTHHFLFGAEEGVTLEGFVVLALDNVGKHLVVHFVRRAIRYSEEENNTHTVGHALRKSHGRLSGSVAELYPR